MSIKASEISDLIGQRIENFAGATEARNVGSVVSVTDGIVRIHGLADARPGALHAHAQLDPGDGHVFEGEAHVRCGIAGKFTIYHQSQAA